MSKQEYYIGWSDSIPKRNKRTLKKLLVPIFILIPLLCLTLAFYTKPFNDHQFEFGNVREFSGIYFANPFPILQLDDGQIPTGFDTHSLLVGYGKSGALGFMQTIEKKNGSLTGKKIKIKGTLINGDGKTLIELTKKEKTLIKILDDSFKINLPTALQKIEESGEILDPKCWFGVMKPGEGKVHKSCAIRCVSGGIPPVFKVNKNGQNEYYILKGENGQDINKEVLPWIAEPVLIRGESFKQNGWNVLKTNPKDFKLIKKN